MKNVEKQLNDILRPIFEELEKEITKNQVSSLDPEKDPQPGNIYHVPTITSLNKSQKVPKGVDGFKLDAPLAGGIKNFIYDVDDSKNSIDAYIQRIFIGYIFGNRLLHMESDEIRKQLLPIITQVLMTAERDVGFHYTTPYAGTYITFFRPGTNKDVVRELENSAAFEFRVYSKCISCINLKED